MSSKLKILFIASGPAAPGTCNEDNPFYYLSEYFSGYVIGSTWNRSDSEQYINQIQSSFGNFKYLPFIRSELPSIFRNLIHYFHYLRIGSRALKAEKVDAIVSYGFLVTGLASATLSLLYKIPLIVEVPGVHDKAIKFTSSKLKIIAEKVLFFSIRVTLKQASAVWFLFKNQLSQNFSYKDKKVYVFHEFAPVSMYSPKTVDENIISFLGYPWKLKGVDILIQAFKIVSPKFPDARLKIAGYCPDREEFIQLAKGFETRIDFINSMERKESIDFMRSTRIFVLPSRTEAMGRVLLEAMAAEKIIIGSNVDGIPHYIDHGQNGLLFESEDINDLANQLEKVLSDKNLCDFLAQNARKKLMLKYTEKHFAQNFYQMVKESLSSTN